jgi:hypothetical protein
MRVPVVNSEPILNGKAGLAHRPVQEVEHETTYDKDTNVSTRGEDHARSSEEDGEGEGVELHDEEYDEEEEDEIEDEEEEEEPALKYERLGGAVPDLLEKDTASAVAVSVKFLVCSDFPLYTSNGVFIV